jgi:hypothetical protein
MHAHAAGPRQVEHAHAHAHAQTHELLCPPPGSQRQTQPNAACMHLAYDMQATTRRYPNAPNVHALCDAEHAPRYGEGVVEGWELAAAACTRTRTTTAALTTLRLFYAHDIRAGLRFGIRPGRKAGSQGARGKNMGTQGPMEHKCSAGRGRGGSETPQRTRASSTHARCRGWTCGCMYTCRQYRQTAAASKRHLLSHPPRCPLELGFGTHMFWSAVVRHLLKGAWHPTL